MKKIQKAVLITWAFVVITLVAVLYSIFERRQFSALYTGAMIILALLFVLGYGLYSSLKKKKKRK